MYDLLIKSGRVIDEGSKIDRILDVAINGDKIVKIDENISAEKTHSVIDAHGKIVTAGLIDAHCHCYHGVLKNGVDPDIVGVKQGVTTVVDGGSAGQAIFGGFPRYVIPSSRTTIYCFLHIGSQGLSLVPEIKDWTEINVSATEKMINNNRELIKGIKLRLVGNLLSIHGIEVIKIAKKIAGKFGLPIVIHIGDVNKQVPVELSLECLKLMESGDILAHIYTAKHGGLISSDCGVHPELRAAVKRGVILDSAHGTPNLSYDIARRGMVQGVVPDIISSDVSNLSINGPVYGMTVTMSKFLALGFNLKQVIKMSTINPAKAVRIDDKKGSLKAGMDADVSILEELLGNWLLEDSERQIIEAKILLVPRITVKAGQIIRAESPIPVQEPTK